jgi:hypothetical protein
LWKDAADACRWNVELHKVSNPESQ